MIYVHDRLDYLHTVKEVETCDDQCRRCFNMQTWHEILGHCNFDDIQRLQSVQTRNRQPDVRAKTPLALVHTDLARPIHPESRDGHRYALSFTDDFSSVVFVYFLKNKSDTVQATKKFLLHVDRK